MEDEIVCLKDFWIKLGEEIDVFVVVYGDKLFKDVIVVDVFLCWLYVDYLIFLKFVDVLVVELDC